MSGNIDWLIGLAEEAQRALRALDRAASESELDRLSFDDLGELAVRFDGLYGSLGDMSARVHRTRDERITFAQRNAQLRSGL